MTKFVLVSLFALTLALVGCATTQTVVTEKTTVSEKYPYNNPTFEQSVGVEWKW